MDRYILVIGQVGEHKAFCPTLPAGNLVAIIWKHPALGIFWITIKIAKPPAGPFGKFLKFLFLDAPNDGSSSDYVNQ